MDTWQHFYQLFVFVLSLHLQHLPSSLKSNEKENPEKSLSPQHALYFCRLFALCLSVPVCACPYPVSFSSVPVSQSSGLSSLLRLTVSVSFSISVCVSLSDSSSRCVACFMARYLYISFVGINVLTHFIHGRKLCKDALRDEANSMPGFKLLEDERQQSKLLVQH